MQSIMGREPTLTSGAPLVDSMMGDISYGGYATPSYSVFLTNVNKTYISILGSGKTFIRYAHDQKI